MRKSEDMGKLKRSAPARRDMEVISSSFSAFVSFCLYF